MDGEVFSKCRFLAMAESRNGCSKVEPRSQGLGEKPERGSLRELRGGGVEPGPARGTGNMGPPAAVPLMCRDGTVPYVRFCT